MKISVSEQSENCERYTCIASYQYNIFSFIFQPQSAMEKTQGIIGRVKKPTEAQAKKKIFHLPVLGNAECILLILQRSVS